VSLFRAEKPLVGTGLERIVALDSGTVVMARRGGVVDYVDAGPNRDSCSMMPRPQPVKWVWIIYNLTECTRARTKTPTLTSAH